MEAIRKRITTWYKKKSGSDDYAYNHFTYGHTDERKPEGHKSGKWAKCYCYLDVSKKISVVID